MLPGNLKHFQTFLSEDDKAVSRTEQNQNKISSKTENYFHK